MFEIRKLENEMNPKLAKRVVCYLANNYFCFKDLLDNTERFRLVLCAFNRFINDGLNVTSLTKMLIDLEDYEPYPMVGEMIDDITNVASINQLLDLAIAWFKKCNLDDDCAIIKLLLNHWLYNNGYSLIVFYPHYINSITHFIKEGNNDECVKSIIVEIYKQSFELNTIYPVLSLADVIDLFHAVEQILRSQFQVSHLAIYGSYRLQTQTQYSDIDVYIETIEPISNTQVYSISDYLSAIMRIKVNVTLDKTFLSYEPLKVI
jgi:predicted nucleotidyltransferase